MKGMHNLTNSICNSTNEHLDNYFTTIFKKTHLFTHYI